MWDFGFELDGMVYSIPFGGVLVGGLCIELVCLLVVFFFGVGKRFLAFGGYIVCFALICDCCA